MIVSEELNQLEKHTESVFLDWSGALALLSPEPRMASTNIRVPTNWPCSWGYRTPQRSPLSPYPLYREPGDLPWRLRGLSGLFFSPSWLLAEHHVSLGCSTTWSQLSAMTLGICLSVHYKKLSLGAILGKILSFTVKKGPSLVWRGVDGATAKKSSYTGDAQLLRFISTRARAPAEQQVQRPSWWADAYVKCPWRAGDTKVSEKPKG